MMQCSGIVHLLRIADNVWGFSKEKLFVWDSKVSYHCLFTYTNAQTRNCVQTITISNLGQVNAAILVPYDKKVSVWTGIKTICKIFKC